MTIEEPLAGGFDSSHPVVRVGDTVRRPPRQSSDSVRALLLHLERVGFDGAPRSLGRDEQGRDVLSFVEGEVPLPPYPAWAMTDDALRALSELLQRYHSAVASFDHDGVHGWEADWADPLGVGIACHNDPFPENTVFRNGLPVALIDFDISAPGRPWWDLAVATQEWVPLKAPPNRTEHTRALDAVARFGVLARAYGITPADAEAFVAVVVEERAQAVANIRKEVAAGTPLWVEHWRENEVPVAIDDVWIERNRAALVAAI